MQEVIVTILISVALIGIVVFSFRHVKQSSSIVSYSFVLIRLVLGVLFIYAGSIKLNNELPTPTETIDKLSGYVEENNQKYFSIVSYIDGMKHTGFAYQVLAISEILFGLLILIQFTSFIGAIFLIPVTLHIFLLHIFLEWDEKIEVFYTGVLFLSNLALIFKEKDKWKHLIWISPIRQKD